MKNIFLMFIVFFLLPLILLYPKTQGERNVQKAMPHAQKEFGKGGYNEYAKFRYMVRNFEKPEGFQGEAEMEAAAIVLNVTPGEVINLLKD